MPPAMDNRPTWVIDVEAALKRGMLAYKEAAERIVVEMEAAKVRGERLTQVAVAEHLGRHPAYVTRLLKWLLDGCDPEGPFAPEAAARRLRRRNSEPWLTDPDTGKVVVDASREPNAAAVLKAHYFSERQAEAVVALDRSVVAGASSSGRQIKALEDLEQALRQAASVTEQALRHVQQVLAEARPMPDNDEQSGDPSKEPPF